MMPLEKALAFAYQEKKAITLDDKEIIKKFALPFSKAIDIAIKNRHSPCKLRNEQMVLDSKGDAILCCTIYDQQSYSLGNFLDVPLHELQRLKIHSPNNKKMCTQCMEKGLHIYSTYSAEEFDQAGIRNILEHYQKLLTTNTQR